VHVVRTIPIDKVERDPGQPRKRFFEDKLRELATSILENGMAQLPSVKAHPTKPDHYVLVTGERRWRAMKMAGLTEHQFTVLEGEVGSSYDLSVVENRHRVDLDPVEEAEMMKRYFDEGRTMAEVMRITGYSDFTIYRRMELLDLHPDVQGMIIEGKLPPIKALRLRKVPLADQIRRAHLLINGTPLDFDEEQLRLDRKARKVKASFANPSEALLGRVMKFAWSSRSAAVHIGALLTMSPEDFAELLRKINVASRQTLETRFGELAVVSQELASQLEAMRFGKPLVSVQDKSALLPAPPPEPQTPLKPRPPAFAFVREPILFNGHLPPENFTISREGRARAETCRDVLGYLFCNPERHGRVNLSKQRLGSVLALPSDRNPEELALGVLRVAWASWDMQPKHFQPGPQRQFLEKIGRIRESFGSSFSVAMNAAWLQDTSPDPVSLGKLVATANTATAA
jgi:ParB/RepB/Spo0J family partition protein